MTPFPRALAIAASAALCWLYARGGAAWVLGLFALVPWLRTQDAPRTLAATLLDAWAMSVAYTAAVFAWFAGAIGGYTGWGSAAGLALLLLAAPLLQPQFLAFALARRLAGRRHGPLLRALAAAAAWVATEWAVPRLLGDTLGHGLHPSRVLRQAADVGGATGLTLVLLLSNEALAAALARRAHGLRAMARPLALALLGPALLAGYGMAVLSAAPAPAGKPLRIGLVQSNITDYERLRRERGAGAVVREVLDTHFAMSYDAVEHQHADAVLWSETVYPTTFGHPKSEAGAALDREILAIVDAARVPFVFGTFDVDAAGEYNAAAFVEPGRGLLGFYRKTRLFPLTEHVPAWLDGPTLRRWLPWAGTWQAGDGARVFPLRLADGREIPVQALICRDDTDAGLAIAGARLGAQALLTLSNDAWFSDDPHGAELHQAVAAFRSIETRLPQFRVTTNGFSAAIDASGSVVAGSRMDERTLVIGDLPARQPPRTLMVAWGDWVGRAAAVFLALLVALAALGRARFVPPRAAVAPAFPMDVVVLPRSVRLASGALRTIARLALAGMVAAAALGDAAWMANTLAQIRLFAGLVLVPEAAAWCALRAFAARAMLADGLLVLVRGQRRLELPLIHLGTVRPWRLPIPGPGVSLRLADGRPWHYELALARPDAFADAVARDAGLHASPRPPSRVAAWTGLRASGPRGVLARPLAKFVALPLALAVPAFRLHQHIAYGGAFGEAYSFGVGAWLRSFALWWAAWTIAVVLCAAALRAAIEAATLAGLVLAPAGAGATRERLEWLGLAGLYLGLPAWFAWRLLGA